MPPGAPSITYLPSSSPTPTNGSCPIPTPMVPLSDRGDLGLEGHFDTVIVSENVNQTTIVLNTANSTQFQEVVVAFEFSINQTVEVRVATIAIQLWDYQEFSAYPDNSTTTGLGIAPNYTDSEVAQRLDSITITAEVLDNSTGESLPLSFVYNGLQLVAIWNSTSLLNASAVRIQDIQSDFPTAFEYYLDVDVVVLQSFRSFSDEIVLLGGEELVTGNASAAAALKEKIKASSGAFETHHTALVALLKSIAEALKKGDVDEAAKLLEKACTNIEDLLLPELENLRECLPTAKGSSKKKLKKAIATLEQLMAQTEAEKIILNARIFLLREFKYLMPDVGVVQKEGKAEYQKTASPRKGQVKRNIRLDPELACDEGALLHEYGHAVHWEKPGYKRAGGPHTATVPDTDPRAFNEGWATFFATIVRRNPLWEVKTKTNGRQIVAIDVEKNLSKGKMPQEGTRKKVSEMTVSAVLWDLVDGEDGLPDTDEDGLVIPVANVFMCLCEGPASFFDFLKALCCKYDNDIFKKRLLKILKDNKVGKYKIPEECKPEED